ncbi:hypothetical protein ACFL2Q_18545 [Thermodesulfobacteriota bacterium]
MKPGQHLKSANGKFLLAFQKDGNLVLYRVSDDKPLWHTCTDGEKVEDLVMQDDGNLVIYAPGGKPIWASETDGNPGAYVRLQDDGNLVIYVARKNGEHPKWDRHVKSCEESDRLVQELQCRAIKCAGSRAVYLLEDGRLRIMDGPYFEGRFEHGDIVKQPSDFCANLPKGPDLTKDDMTRGQYERWCKKRDDCHRNAPICNQNCKKEAYGWYGGMSKAQAKCLEHTVKTAWHGGKCAACIAACGKTAGTACYACLKSSGLDCVQLFEDVKRYEAKCQNTVRKDLRKGHNKGGCWQAD